MRKNWSWLRFFASTIFFLFAVMIFLGWALLGKAASRALEWDQRFSSTAGQSSVALLPEAVIGFSHGRHSKLTPQTWLILGTDEVEGSGRTNILTDTILVASFDPAGSVVRLLSLPRDIYLPLWQTKINNLYWQALQKELSRPQDETAKAITELTGIQFNGAVVVRLSDMEKLIDDLDGVELEVPQAFTDERFPRSDVDVTKETDPKKLYETLNFTAGKQTMDGKTAVKYMRSRHSSDVQEGNDEARTRRQQQVIEALVAKLAQQQNLLRPTLLGKLYRWYSDRFEADASLYQLGVFAGMLEQTRQLPQIERVPLEVTELPRPASSSTLFIHPPEAKYKQWAYELVDPSGKQLKEYLRSKKLVW